MLWCTSLLSWIGVATTPYQRRLSSANWDCHRKTQIRCSEEISELWGPQCTHLHHSFCRPQEAWSEQGENIARCRVLGWGLPEGEWLLPGISSVGSPVHNGQVQTTDTQTTAVASAEGVYIFVHTHNIYSICTYRYMYVTIITRVGAGRYWRRNRRNMGEIGRKGKRSSM